MKPLAILLFLAASLAPLSAHAGTFPIPAENPIATISIPDTWGPKPYEGGIEGTSADGKVYVAIEQVEAADIKAAVEQGFAFFAKQGVELDPATMGTKDIKIDGLDALDMVASGKDKEGPADVSLTLVSTNSTSKFLLLYYWGSSEGAKANIADLKAMADSIQATK
jgi:hypothetical protein